MGTNFAKGKDALKQGYKQQAMQWFKQEIAEEPKNAAKWAELFHAIDNIEKQPYLSSSSSCLKLTEYSIGVFPYSFPLSEWFE